MRIEERAITRRHKCSMAETHAPWQILHPTQQTRPAPPKTHCSVGSLPMLLLKLLAMKDVTKTLLQYLMARMSQCCHAMLKEYELVRTSQQRHQDKWPHRRDRSGWGPHSNRRVKHTCQGLLLSTGLLMQMNRRLQLHSPRGHPALP